MTDADLLRRAADVLKQIVAAPMLWLVAALLDAHADVAQANEALDGFDLAAVDDTHGRAVALARAILREQP